MSGVGENTSGELNRRGRWPKADERTSQTIIVPSRRIRSPGRLAITGTAGSWGTHSIRSLGARSWPPGCLPACLPGRQHSPTRPRARLGMSDPDRLGPSSWLPPPPPGHQLSPTGQGRGKTRARRARHARHAQSHRGLMPPTLFLAQTFSRRLPPYCDDHRPAER